MKTLKDITKSASKTGVDDDAVFKATNVKQTKKPNHGYLQGEDEAAWKRGQNLPRKLPFGEEAILEKITHAQKYAKSTGDSHVARYQVSKNGKKVGFIKHTKKGDNHEKMAFFALGATKATAYNSKRIPGDNHAQKIAHMIKMHVKEDVDTPIQQILEEYSIDI